MTPPTARTGSFLLLCTWQNLAAEQEVFDLDLCGGHAANGEYHHHAYSRCLAETVGDDGTGHSPIYGFSADGYAIHGPWHASGVASRSCWVQRDYDDASDPTGCGGTGRRTCVMVDPPMSTTATTTTGSATTTTSPTPSRTSWDPRCTAGSTTPRT